MRKILFALLCLVSVGATGSGLENNIRFLSTDADVSDNVIENVYLPSASYETPTEGRLFTLKIDKNGDRLVTAQVLAYLDDPSDLGCSSPSDACDLIVTDIYESSALDKGVPVLPDFGGQVLVGSALHPIFFNQLVGGCDVIIEFGQSNSCGSGGTIGVEDVPDNKILQWSRVGQSSESESEFVVSDGGVDCATDNDPHQVGLAFTFATEWLDYQQDDSNIDHLIRTGGSVRPVCIISMGANSTGHKYDGTGYWGENYGDYPNGGRADFVNHLSNLLNAAPNIQPLVALYSQMEWETRTSQGIGGNSIEAWPENVKEMWEFFVEEIPELQNIKLMYFGLTESCGTGIGGSWPNCPSGYQVVAGTYTNQTGNGGDDSVSKLDDILDNAYYVEETNATNGTGSALNQVHFTPAGQRLRAQTGFTDWLAFTGRQGIDQAVPEAMALTLTPSSGVIDFSWPNDTAGLPADTEYYLKISGADDPTFSSPIYGAVRCTFGVDCLTTNSYQATGLTNESTYYAELQGVNSSTEDAGNDGGAGWGDVTQGNTVPFYAAPENVTLTAGDGLVTVAWDAASNSDAYSVQCDDNSDFSSPTYDSSGCTVGGDCTTPPTVSEPATGLSNGTPYYCRVRSHDGAPNNVWGRWSTTSSPATSTPAATPEPLVTGLTATDGDDAETTITWTGDQGSPSDFRCQVDEDVAFGSPEFDQSLCTPTVNCPTASGINTASDPFDPSVLVNDTAYYVRCAAYNAAYTGDGWGAYVVMTTPATVTPTGGGGGSSYAATWALTDLVAHTQYNLESAVAVAEKSLSCVTDGNPCTTDNQNVSQWWVPDVVGKPSLGYIAVGAYSGINNPMQYDSATGGMFASSNSNRHMSFHDGGTCTTSCTGGDPTTDVFGTGYSKIMRVETFRSPMDSENFISLSGTADVLWINPDNSGTLCMGNSGGTTDLCSTSALPVGDHVITAIHNGLSGASAKGQIHVYDVSLSSDTTGTCGTANAGGTPAVKGTIAAPTVLCTNAENGYWAFETTSEQDSGDTEIAQMVVNGYSGTAGGGGNPSNGCDDCLYRNIILTTEGVTLLAADVAGAPYAANATVISVIQEMEEGD